MYVERYEKIWIILAAAMMVIFLSAILVSIIAGGIHLPGNVGPMGMQMPQAPVAITEPGLHQSGNGNYTLYLTAQMWNFNPAEVRIPAGSTLTIYGVSKDVTHGLKVEGTDVNVMLVPGEISKATARFDKPGTYLFICHEYCGLGHQGMSGKIIVE